MKNLILLAFSLFALNSFASEINCEKQGAKITIDKKTVTIEASNVPMNDDIREMVGETSGSVNVSVNISFPVKDLKCSTGMAKVFNCSGATKKASVTISISEQSMFGSSNRQNMRRPVKIQNIDISSSVGAQGPIVLGDGPTTVNLDQVIVKSSMFVKMSGDFQLDLEQVFKNSAECK